MSVLTVDLGPWFAGGDGGRAAVAAQVDEALRARGRLLVTGHGVGGDRADRVRTGARLFFSLAAERKARCSARAGDRGWLPPVPGRAEGYAFGADTPTGDPWVDGYWCRPNVWSDDVPELRTSALEYMTGVRALSDELLRICAVALGQDAEHFTAHTGRPVYAFTVHRYPWPPHPNRGTLGVVDPGGPAGALTVGVGALLARWTGDRWPAAAALEPLPAGQERDPLALVWTYAANPHSKVRALGPPVGRRTYRPVTVCDHLATDR